MTKVVHCLHCGRRQRRHMRTGKWFRCRFCGETNPGPDLVESMNRAALNRPKTAAKRKPREEPREPVETPAASGEAPAEPLAPSVAVAAKPVRRRSATVKRAAPARAEGEAQEQQQPASTPEAPAGKSQKSFLERLMYG